MNNLSVFVAGVLIASCVPVGPVFAASTSASSIAAWGDSMTHGYADSVPYPTQLAQLFNNERTVFNGGRSSETALNIRGRLEASTDKQNYTTVIWAGQNGYADADAVISDIAKMVQDLGSNQHYVILSVVTRSIDPKGTPLYENVIRINQSLAAAYPGHYLDIRSYLVAQYDPNNSQDVSDHAQDITPSSLRYDVIHLKTEGNALVARQVYDFIVANLDPLPPANNPPVDPTTLPPTQAVETAVFTTVGSTFTFANTTRSWSLTEGTTTGNHSTNIYLPVLRGSMSDTWSLTFFARPAGRTRIRAYVLNASNSANGYGAMDCLLVGEGSVPFTRMGSSAKGLTAQATATNGWYKCSMALQPDTVTGEVVRLSLQLESTTGSLTTSYTGDGSAGMQLRDFSLTERSPETIITPHIESANMVPVGTRFTRDTTSNIWSLVENATTGTHTVNMYLPITADTMTDTWAFTFLAKSAGRTRVRAYVINADNSANGYGSMDCSLTGTGSVPFTRVGTSAKNLKASAATATEGWYHCSLAVQPDSVVGAKLRLSLQLEEIDPKVTTSYTGDDHSGVLLRDLNLERTEKPN